MDNILKENKLNVNISGYEGPLDLLIELSKKQKVDITKVSILELAEQYLSYVNKNLYDLKLSADYLVMASFLAFLKSKLLLPKDEIEEGNDLSSELANRLLHYNAIKIATNKLNELPRLNKDFYIRKNKNEFIISNKIVINASLHDFLKYYIIINKKKEKLNLQMKENIFYSIEDGYKWLSVFFKNKNFDWLNMAEFLPSEIKELKMKKSAFISLILATLTLAKNGEIEINQDNMFSKIYIKKIVKNE